MKRFFCGLALSVLALTAAPSIRVSAAANNTIVKGVKIGDIDASGMTVAEAKEAVKNKVENVVTGEIVLTGANGKKVTVHGTDLGLSWSNPDVVKEAYAVGHEGNVVQRYKEGKDVEQSSRAFNIEYNIDDEALSTVIRKCSTEFNKDLETINLAEEKEKDKKGKKANREKALKEGESEQATGIKGYLVNIDESKEILKDFIENSWAEDNTEVEIAVRTVDAFKNEEALQKMSDVLGTYTTSYKTSGAARCANVENGCAHLNGITLDPGEELSILDTITPFTEENGYYPAGSYLNGLVVESIGGGICQVSSTLYNAVLLAELDVIERHNHSMIVSYVEPSADAAIAQSGGKDFKFRNNTDSPIYIEGICTPDKHITFTIYGHDKRPAGRKVTYKSIILDKTPASEDKYMTDPSQALGYVGMQSAHLGYKSQLCKVVEEDGVEAATKIINTSTYNMVPRIITVGTKGADEKAMAELKTAMESKDISTIRSVASQLGLKKSATTTDSESDSKAASTDDPKKSGPSSPVTTGEKTTESAAKSSAKTESADKKSTSTTTITTEKKTTSGGTVVTEKTTETTVTTNGEPKTESTSTANSERKSDSDENAEARNDDHSSDKEKESGRNGRKQELSEG